MSDASNTITFTVVWERHTEDLWVCKCKAVREALGHVRFKNGLYWPYCNPGLVMNPESFDTLEEAQAYVVAKIRRLYGE